ncbi:MAG: glycosyltransferase family 39 protein [Streptosporangiaceae bacterium]
MTRHSAHSGPRPTRNRARRLLRGPEADPGWARPALLELLALTAVLYLWNLTRNGWANDFYSAAVQAGTKSWKAFFFGSFDASNFITVDKTPGSLWVMELSGRIFGFSQWSMLVPQALEGVASVGLLYAAVKRWFGPQAGLIAGLVLALTPVAALMFRYNNPDALLVLLMTAAAYTLVRALENGRTKWLVFCGVLLGFAFLTKMLQAFLVVPGFAVAYLWAGPPRPGRRIWQTLLMGAGIIAGAGWWILAAELTPAADRPYFGGSTDNNILQLAIGYNGLGRLDGNETGSIGAGGGGQGNAFGGATGLLRLFHSEFGGQISWLLPAAVIALGAMLWVSRRAVRTDRTRAAALLWGGWVVVTGLVFSYMSGIIHPYYMVALAPGIAALVGIGSTVWWRATVGWAGRSVAAAALAVTAVWAFVLLDRTPHWLPWVRWVVVVAALAGAGLLLAGPHLAGLARSRRSRLVLAVAPLALALVAGLAGPAAYALDTVSTTYTGSIPSAGPQAAGGFGGGPGGGPGGSFRGGAGGQAGALRPGSGTAGGSSTGSSSSGTAGTAPGGSGSAGTVPGGGGSAGTPPSGTAPAGMQPGGTGTRPGGSSGTGSLPGAASREGGAGGFGGAGGLGGNTTVSKALVELLEQDASKYKWVAATEGSEGAAPLELATGDAVIAIGGFNGTDPWPTLAAFKELVAKHEVHDYVGQGSESFGGGHGSSTIASWVGAHFKKETVGGETVYDLTQPVTGTT